MIRPILLSLFLLTSLGGAARAGQPHPPACDGQQVPSTQAQEATLKEPEDYAHAALDRGDRRLLVFRGNSQEVPGVDMYFDDAKNSFGVAMIETAGDVMCSRVEKRSDDEARQYVERYNRFIVYGHSITRIKISVKEMRDNDPELVAEKAMERGDRRLMAVYGYSIHTPGSGMDLTKSMRAGMLAIVGTSDAIMDWDDRVLNDTARKYAIRYNRYLTQYASLQGPKRWDPADQWPPPPGPYQWEGWKKVLANPMAEAKVALEHGDRRLMAVQADEIEAPGVGVDFFEAEKRFGIVLIDDTRDPHWSIHGAGHRFFKQKARRYATLYNEYIVQHASPPSP